jgi:hypothetical protein
MCPYFVLQLYNNLVQPTDTRHVTVNNISRRASKNWASLVAKCKSNTCISHGVRVITVLTILQSLELQIQESDDLYLQCLIILLSASGDPTDAEITVDILVNFLFKFRFELIFLNFNCS